jgi:hypothetical protein
MDGLLGSLLAYRVNVSVIDKLLAEAGFNSGSNPLQALVSAMQSELPGSAKPVQLQAEIHAALQEWTEALANGHDETPVTALYDKDPKPTKANVTVPKIDNDGSSDTHSGRVSAARGARDEHSTLARHGFLVSKW